MSLFDRIRAAAAAVAERARSVAIDEGALASLAIELEGPAAEPPTLDPARHRVGSDETTLAYIVTLDAVNFGSGWFPQLRKRAGCSGYFTVATALKERFEREGPWSAPELARLDAAECARVFGQDLAIPEMHELMTHFARALADLGRLLSSRHGDRFEVLVESASGSAETLVQRLAEMPYYRDVSRYGELEVPLYKRAQLTAADLAVAFGGAGFGRFRDLDELTIFADNLVPHVLRRSGVLRYAADLARRIDRGHLLEAGSREEVEIRAVALHAVERMVAVIRERGGEATARRLDFVLWNRGQETDMKAHPRHRARSVYY